ncbi:hypothetical protein Fmac_001540 [Flemingia macrophylla]|uniref:Leucine-rich repeat-containing N-terminal plant-type domain-containing protein n=1 Tax=Flemingia macrophylla TaxID=520843 RepID=A0ABD1NK81_9FABA
MEGDALDSLRTNLQDPNNVLQSWDPTLVNPCTWFHVTCNNDNSVIRVDLGNATLSGQLVPQLGQLKNLQYLLWVLYDSYSDDRPQGNALEQRVEKILRLEQQSVNLGRRLIGLGRRLVVPEQNERLQRRLNPSSMSVLPLLPSDTQQLLQQANMQPDNEDDQQPSAGHYGNDY